MIAIIQRVTKASVSIPAKKQSIKTGFLILLGVNSSDTETDVKLLADKTIKLRIMSDKDKKMNLSLSDVHGEVLVISQFTLLGDVSKGNRPSFIKAAPPKLAKKLYNQYIEELRNTGLSVKTGYFGEYMEVSLINDGPTTIILDSQQFKR